MAKILDGKLLAEKIRSKIKDRVATFKVQPGLAVILVGSDPASHIYVGLKQAACEEAGIHFEKFLYDETTSEQTILDKVEELNQRTDVHAILVQLPLPNQDASTVIAAINPLKDVDGFHKENLELMRQGKPSIASAVALGVVRLIRKAVGDSPLPPNATIVSSPLFAEPLVILLEEQRVKVVVTQAEDPDLASKTKSSEILIVAEGEPGLITGEMVKEGAVVIDVGTTKVDGKLLGDVDFDSVNPVAGALTPVPGGVGPMTVAMLLVNILKAQQLQSLDK